MSDDPNLDQRDRLVRLEENVKHLRSQVDGLQKGMDEVVSIMQQAKGARWVILAAASVGGFLATKAATFMGMLPK